MKLESAIIKPFKLDEVREEKRSNLCFLQIVSDT